MTNAQKKKRIESHWDHPVICPGCGKEIKPDDDMWEYVRTVPAFLAGIQSTP